MNNQIREETARLNALNNKAQRLGGSISEIALVLHNLDNALDRVNAGENPQAIIEYEIKKWKERETALGISLDLVLVEASL